MQITDKINCRMAEIGQEELFYQITKSLDKAGNLLLEYFVKNIRVHNKHDNSPVTEADLAVNDFICDMLSKYSDLPIVSEEHDAEDNIKAASQDEFWIIDPLDGTQSFINKNQEFAICLAKIKNNRPEFGFIHVPFQKDTYYSDGQNAYRRNFDQKVMTLGVKKKDIGLHILSSQRMKNNMEFADFIAQYDVEQISVISSAIKFCHVAKGDAQLYPYFADTMQWDSAAGDAIVKAAGGRVTDLQGNALYYGPKNNFVNPYFVVQA